MINRLLLFYFCLIAVSVKAQDNNQSIEDMFTADTCRIESDLNFERKIWPNHEFYIFMLQRYAYDDLGEKYASLLVKKLNDTDGILFRTAQSKWGEFYSSQVYFLAANVSSPRFEEFLADLTKNRAIQIYKYLLLTEIEKK